MSELAALDRLPDIGEPLIGDGGQFSKGLPAVNRMADILTMPQPRTYDETVRYKTASPLVNITEGDIGRATEAAMGVSGGGLSTKGIKAYHSSPHDFDKFDLAKIGTGEGAQVYGHGLYFAENPAVSGQGGQYWQQFAQRFGGPEGQAARRLEEAKFDREGVLKTLTEHLERARSEPTNKMYGDFARQSHIDMLQKQYDLLASGKPVGPRTYEVNINADPAHMLDWDKPLREQPAKVVSALGDKLAAQKARGEVMMPSYLKQFEKGELPGEAVYGGFGRGTKESATQALREAGIPGIKYLDEGSRISSPGQIKLIRENIAQRENLLKANPGNPTDLKWLAEYQDMLKRAENPTSNYVIFDPSKIDIMKKYAMPGMIGAGGMSALAAQDQYQP
jgi:hypothetical protein